MFLFQAGWSGWPFDHNFNCLVGQRPSGHFRILVRVRGLGIGRVVAVVAAARFSCATTMAFSALILVEVEVSVLSFFGSFLSAIVLSCRRTLL